eukprot:2834716-Prymnesium_polylepis.1
MLHCVRHAPATYRGHVPAQFPSTHLQVGLGGEVQTGDGEAEASASAAALRAAPRGRNREKARCIRDAPALPGRAMTSLVGTMKHVSTPSRKVVKRHTMSRPCACRARVS